jgi:hypothetical protein
MPPSFANVPTVPVARGSFIGAHQSVVLPFICNVLFFKRDLNLFVPVGVLLDTGAVKSVCSPRFVMWLGSAVVAGASSLGDAGGNDLGCDSAS